MFHFHPFQIIYVMFSTFLLGLYENYNHYKIHKVDFIYIYIYIYENSTSNIFPYPFSFLVSFCWVPIHVLKNSGNNKTIIWQLYKTISSMFIHFCPGNKMKLLIHFKLF